MEGVLLIIGVIGIQMTADPQRWMPLWGAGELLARSAGLPSAASAGAAILYSLVYAAVLLPASPSGAAGEIAAAGARTSC